MLTVCRDWSTAIGLLVLRLGFGAYMVTHGWGKLERVFRGEFDKFGDPIGIGTGPSLVLVAFAEVICMFLLMVGLGTRLAAVPAIIAMVVAAFVAHGNDPWTMGAAAELFRSGQAQHWGSKQPALMFLLAFLTLAFTGAGKLSLDHLLCGWWSKRCKTAKAS